MGGASRPETSWLQRLASLGVSVLNLTFAAYIYVWPPLRKVIESGGRDGVDALVRVLAEALAFLLAIYGVMYAITWLWRKNRKRSVWILTGLALTSAIFGLPAWRAFTTGNLQSLSERAALLGTLGTMGLMAWVVGWMIDRLSGWKRSFTRLGVVTACWLAVWSAVILNDPATDAVRQLSTSLLVLGPILIAWAVALAYWRIDISSRKPTGATAS